MTKVELVSRTQGVGLYEGLKEGEIVEAVARHGKIKDFGKLIAFLIRHKHWSPLEHVHFTFRIETARDISAQMMRHRSFHWQELSQRYDVIQEFMPIEIRKQSKYNHQSSEEVFNPICKYEFELNGGEMHSVDIYATHVVANAIVAAQSAYDALIKAGVARECARRILPMCAKTVVHMTGNLRDFLGYLNVRCEQGTQKEHREVAMGIGYALANEIPDVFKYVDDWKTGKFM